MAIARRWAPVAGRTLDHTLSAFAFGECCGPTTEFSGERFDGRSVGVMTDQCMPDIAHRSSGVGAGIGMFLGERRRTSTRWLMLAVGHCGSARRRRL